MQNYQKVNLKVLKEQINEARFTLRDSSDQLWVWWEISTIYCKTDRKEKRTKLILISVTFID